MAALSGTAVEQQVWDKPINLASYLDNPESDEAKAECKRVAESLSNVGALVVRDPRATESDNDNFLNMMESYFSQPKQKKLNDVRPKLAHQIGATPDGTEVPRAATDPSYKARMEQFQGENKPLAPTGPDVKWRFFHRIGERPKETEYAELNSPPVQPEAFPQWCQVMDKWGNTLLNAGFAIAEMAAVGFGLPRDTFTSRMKNGPHLLAPTGSDLGKHGKMGQILAGFHQDLNFLTIHGKSRFPGLSIWLRDGRKVAVKVPQGCLLVQAGMQIEYLTGGKVLAGYHEVVVTDATLKEVEKRRKEGHCLWRISSTLFSHTASDKILEPLVGSKEEIEQLKKKFPPVKAGEQVLNELRAIKLSN